MDGNKVKEYGAILTIVAGMFGALIAGLPKIMDSYGNLTKDNIKQELEAIREDLIDPELFNEVHAVYLAMQAKKGFAVGLRKDPDNPFQTDVMLYRASDGNTYPAFWVDSLKSYIYLDITRGQHYPAFYEDKVTLKQLRNLAKTLEE